MKKYLQIIKSNSQSVLNYRPELAGIILRKTLEIAFLSIFWNIASAQSTVDISPKEIIIYFILISTSSEIISSDKFYPGRNISTAIKSGKLNMSLIRPVNELVYHYLEDIGNRLPVILLSTLFFLAASTLANTNITGLLLSGLFIIFAFIISISLNTLIAITAFYIVENFVVVYGFQISTRVLSGVFIPLYFFPEKIIEILNFTPIPYLAYIPVEYITNTSIDFSLTIQRIVIVIFWSILLNLGSYLLWKKALKKYEAIGI